MNGWRHVEEWSARCALGGALILLVASFLMLLARQPSKKQRLGELAIAASLVLAVLTWLPGWLPWGWSSFLGLAIAPAVPTSPETATEGFAWIALETARSPASADTFLDLPAPETEACPKKASFFTTEDAGEHRAASPSSRWWNGRSARGLGAWIAGGYVAIALLIWVRWLAGCFLLWRRLRCSQPATSAVAQLFDQSVAGATRRPRLLVTDSVQAPFSCGLLRPVIVLPRCFCESADRDQLRWIFAHELSHLERRDARACLLFGIAQALYFFCPWYWWLRRQVRLCQEYVADAAAIRVAGAEDYAQFLLSLVTAPAVPRNAIGVIGKTSDLFRRVTMLLENSDRVQAHCSRWWSIAAGGALLALAIGAAGIGLGANAATPERAAPGDDNAPVLGDEPQIHTSVIDDNGGERIVLWADVDEKQPSVDADKLEKLREAQRELQKAQARLQEALDQLRGKQIRVRVSPVEDGKGDAHERNRVFSVITRVSPDGGRLGVVIEPPSPALAEQLDLASDQGMVIVNVRPDSAAAKAGIRKNDILLELDGKTVPRDTARLHNMVGEIKAHQEFAAVILRKGHKETIKGLSLPEGTGERHGMNLIEAFPGMHGMAKEMPGLPGFPLQTFSFGSGEPGHKGIMTTLFRNGERFTARHQEGNLIVTVTGSAADHKARVTEIQVQDGATSNKYENLDQVPERYRDKAKSLVEMSEKANANVEIKDP
jgi:beta-lactamase regulating signal transducer with metallopeptidase domain